MYLLIKRRQALTALAVCAALLVGVIGTVAGNEKTAATVSGAVTNWGLSFPEPGKTPVGNATAARLAEFDAYYVGDTAKPVIYLTFDAGYENGNTAAILDALKKHGAKATFFAVSDFIKKAPDIARRMIDEGHTVGNHTYHHPDMSAIMDAESFRRELEDNAALFKETTGADMAKLYRPPQGKFSEKNLQMAKEMGYHTFFWSLAYVDWYVNDQPTPQQAYDKLLPRIHPGAIVLLHTTSATNAAILDELLTKWEEMGYTFAPLNSLWEA